MSAVQRVVRRPDTTLVTFGGAPERTFKLSQRQVMQVEQQAGRALEFLSERELAATMQFLGLRALPLDAADQAILANIRQQAAAAAAAPARTAERPPVLTPPTSPPAPAVEDTPSFPSAEESVMARWRMVAGLLVLGIVIIAIALALIFLLRTGGGGGETATPTGTVSAPMAMAINNTLVFAGPGNQYPVVGTLLANQSAPVRGVTADRQWWLIEFSAAPGGEGWVAAAMVRTRNSESVPVVTPPVPTPTATPTATSTPTPPAPTPTLLPPMALIDGPTQAQVGQQIVFSSRRSTAAPGGAITRYDWDFGDGSTASGPEVSKIYGQAGVYNVRLTVSDDKGGQGQAVQQIVVADAPTPTPTPAPPTAVITGPSQALAGQPVVFDAGNSTGASPLVGYFWDFGDGAVGSGQRVEHVFVQPGVYVVILTVQNAQGLVSSANWPVQVSAAPTPTPTPLPSIGLEGVVWLLEDALPGTNITALFSNGLVTGFSGCNNYTGSYVIDGQSLSIAGLVATQQLCAPEIMEQEQRYLASLGAAQSYQIVNGRLTIDTSRENQPAVLRFVLAPR